MNIPVSWKTRKRVRQLYAAVVAVSVCYLSFAVGGAFMTGASIQAPSIGTIAVRAPVGSVSWRSAVTFLVVIVERRSAVASLVVIVELLRQSYVHRAWVGLAVAALAEASQEPESDDAADDDVGWNRR